MPNGEQRHPVDDYTFRPSAVGDAHFVWAPVVHSELGESCYYYLVRFRKPAYGGILDSLKTQLHTQSIASACVYLVYGYWDALVRIWATHSARERFAQQLAATQNSDLIAAREFRVDSIQYGETQTESSYLQLQVVGALPQIRQAVVADELDQIRTSPDMIGLIDELERRGLVIHVAGSLAGSIKFYTVLEPIDGIAWSDFGTAAVRSTLRARLRDAGITSVSIYEGTGFAQVFLKGMAGDLASVQRASEGLAELVYGHLRPTTMILASEGAIEEDAVDEARYVVAGQIVHRYEGILGKTGILRLADEELDFQHEILNLLNLFVELHNSASTRDNFSQVLRAAVFNNELQLRQGLAFVSGLEYELRRLLQSEIGPEIARLSGLPAKKWPQLIRQKARSFSQVGDIDQAEIERKLDTNEWTMSPVRSALFVASAVDTTISEVLDDRLGAGWFAESETALFVRNQAAHGRVFGGSPRLLVNGGIPSSERDRPLTLRDILVAMSLYGRLAPNNVDAT